MIVSPYSPIRTAGKNRKGIIMFVVVGAIVVLTVLVASYNYLVIGKSHESREILKHIRAEKCAQSLCKYIISHLISDLNDTNEGSNIAGMKIRSVLLSSNNSGKLSEGLTKEWLVNIRAKEFIDGLLDGTTGNERPDIPLVEFGFSDIHSLNSLKSSKGIGDDVFYFDGEKVGRITVRTTIKIGKTRAVWQETRPFKVVFPFPVPVTKFNFYWKDGTDDSYSFNTVSIKSDTGDSANGKHPLILDNGSYGDKSNEYENVWIERGWIYVGGNGLDLNRASGSKKYGQNYYSYSEPGAPITLMLDFPEAAGGDRWNEHTFNGERLGFRVAYWGFSDSLTNPNSNQIWQYILKAQYENCPPGTPANDTHWNSSSLHLFGNRDMLRSDTGLNKFEPTITRVMGNVNDRFLEMGYLLPVSSSESLFAAVIGLSKDEYNSLHEEKESGSGNKYNFEKYLYFEEEFDTKNNKEGADALQNYFDKLVYSDSDIHKVDFYKVMSKANRRSFSETYSIISGYSVNNDEISLPPDLTVPETNDLSFQPTTYTSGNFECRHLPDKIIKMNVSEIGKAEDTTLGLSLRTCYEISGSSNGIQSILNTCFCSESNAFDLNLNNLVYKVTPDSGSVIFNNLSINSPGTIYSDGPISVGTFLPTETNLNTPLMLLAGKGPITVNNSGNNEVRAYLVALGEEGTVKAERKDVPL